MKALCLVVVIVGLLVSGCADDESRPGVTQESSSTVVTSAESSSTSSSTTSLAPTTSAPTTTTSSTSTTTAPSTTTTTQPAFTGLELSGSGDDVVDIEVPSGDAAIVTFTHSGSHNFTVWSYDKNGDQIDLLVNTIGAYEGTRPINFLEGEEVALVEIGADGGWTVTVEPLADAPQIPASGRYEGVGDAVLIDPLGPDSAFRGTFTHSGEHNFAVWAWGTTRDLLVNEIGQYDGTVIVPGGTVVYDISADGAWTVLLDR